MYRSRGVTEGLDPPPLKNHKAMGFVNNTGSDPKKITKLPSQHSMLGPSAKRHLNSVLLVGDNGLFLVVFGSSPPSSTKKTTKTSEVDPLQAKLSESAHELCSAVPL